VLSYGIFGSSSKNELSSNLKEDTANQSLKSNKPDSCYSNMKQKTSIFFYDLTMTAIKGRRKKFIIIDRHERHAIDDSLLYTCIIFIIIV